MAVDSDGGRVQQQLLGGGVDLRVAAAERAQPRLRADRLEVRTAVAYVWTTTPWYVHVAGGRGEGGGGGVMIDDDHVTNGLTHTSVGQLFQKMLGRPRPPQGCVDLQDFLARLEEPEGKD